MVEYKGLNGRVVEDPTRIIDLSSSTLVGYLIYLKNCLTDLRFKVRIPPNRDLIVVGDLHGDMDSLEKIASLFRSEEEVTLVLLGDYVDRASISGGSVAVATYLLSLKYLYGDRVHLLQGNHENYYLFPYTPYDLPREVSSVWGEGKDGKGILYVLSSILINLPAIALYDNGIVFTHGGILKGVKPEEIQGVTHRDVEKELGSERYEKYMYSLLWGGPSGYAAHYVSPKANYTEKELINFLNMWDSVVHVRGHDPSLSGRFLFSGMDLTITSYGKWQKYYIIVEGGRRIDKNSILSSLRPRPL